MFFGTGTSLTIETKEEFSPSYFKLGAGSTKACLATGFSRNNVHVNDSLFKQTQPVRIHEDSLYNQVVLLSSKEDEQLCDKVEVPDPCEDSVAQDPALNLLALTVLGLRLIFFKTVVFNVLMTLRLWISQ
ncbi:M1-specific T cell receptor alpha chain-like [Antennarius striatus]|uniref:M1-specific T cell receptor alpha chain-like n=1 Tax=Antennarius striatus TaxID=241820 RepID=UPI0035B012CE